MDDSGIGCVPPRRRWSLRRLVSGGALGVVALTGWLLAATFILSMIGGGIYRTRCVTSSGQITTSWSAEGDIHSLPLAPGARL